MTVSRRQVWYFHGFDPAPPARYRRIFAAASGRLGVTMGDLADGAEGWTAQLDGVTTEVRYLRYEDLVRGFRDLPAGTMLNRWLLRGLSAVYGYLRDGALGWLARRAPRVVGLALAPWIMLFGPALLAAALAAALGGWAAVLIVGLPILMLAVLPRLHLDIVIDLFAYMRMLARGEGPDGQAYHARIGALADGITPGGADETIVVGHSLGGIAAILTTARLLERWPDGRSLGLLTLGSTHGIILAQRGAGRDRLAAAIAAITTDERVFWLDVSSPRDAFCVPLTDPLLMIDAPDGAHSPRVISAQLARAPRIPGDRRTVFAAMRRHMGYLLTPPPGSGFDYAETVSGAQTLADRFGARGNSPRARMRTP